MLRRRCRMPLACHHAAHMHARAPANVMPARFALRTAGIEYLRSSHADSVSPVHIAAKDPVPRKLDLRRACVRACARVRVCVTRA